MNEIQQNICRAAIQKVRWYYLPNETEANFHEFCVSKAKKGGDYSRGEGERQRNLDVS